MKINVPFSSTVNNLDFKNYVGFMKDVFFYECT